MEKKAFKARVLGVVQGVGFRYYTLRKAQSLSGVCGYVKNLPDGSVEILAEGAEDTLKQLLQQVHRGPLGSEVERVDVDWMIASKKYTTFNISF